MVKNNRLLFSYGSGGQSLKSRCLRSGLLPEALGVDLLIAIAASDGPLHSLAVASPPIPYSTFTWPFLGSSSLMRDMSLDLGPE